MLHIVRSVNNLLLGYDSEVHFKQCLVWQIISSFENILQFPDLCDEANTWPLVRESSLGLFISGIFDGNEDTVPNGRDLTRCRNTIFQSAGAQLCSAELVCVAKISHSIRHHSC